MRRTANRLSDRRQVLGALAGVAMSQVPAHGVTRPRRRLGIVGGGMAGVSLAWMVEGERDTVLLEAQPTLGGNVQTVPLEVNGQIYPVDTGAQYFHPKLYRLYVRLLARWGIYPPALQQSHSFPASISVFAETEPFPRFVSPQFWDRLWPILAPWNWDGLGAFAGGFGAAKKREDQRADWNLSLGDWLQTLGLKRRQWEEMLLPWAASLYTGRTEDARAFSARAAMIFAATAVPDKVTDPVVSYVVNKGMGEAIQRMVKQFDTVEVLTRARVEQIQRLSQGGFRISCADRRQVVVDDLVLASSRPTTLRLLEGIPDTGAQQTALRGVEFAPTRIAIHTDPIYSPADPNCWSFLNCQIHGGFCEASMWLTKVLMPQSGGAPPKLWKSWVTHRDRQPANVLHELSFQHMVPTVATLQAQTRLRDLQGRDGIWFAGGYTFPFDAQETALFSALQVAIGLNIVSLRTRLLRD